MSGPVGDVERWRYIDGERLLADHIRFSTVTVGLPTVSAEVLMPSQSVCLDSPLGFLHLVTVDGYHLSEIQIRDSPPFVTATTSTPCPVLQQSSEQLADYFAGRRQQFDLPLSPAGTPFQQRVWQALQQIPFGVTASYQAIARAIGQPTACRAVGGANRRNPLPIVIPCHRVIGARGALVGFSAGIDRKVWLLQHEAEFSPQLSAELARMPSPSAPRT